MAMKSQIITGLTLPSPTPASSSSSTSANSLSLVKLPLTTSFFNGGVTRLRIARSGRPNGYRGRLACRANLFDRFARVIKSYANAVISSFEDPEKILEQAVLEMNDDLVKMRQATAQVLASQKRLENKYKAAQQSSEDWYRKAQLALQKGEEDLAREALKRRKSYADNANALKAQLDQQKNVVGNLVSNTRLHSTYSILCSFWRARYRRQDQRKILLKLARNLPMLQSLISVVSETSVIIRTATKVSEMLGNVNTSSALSAFEKMEEKVMAMESQADALNQLTTDDLEGKFAVLESNSVDDDLANLKRELTGSSKKGDLPPGRPVAASSNTSFPFRDAEIENELNELRQRAKDL